MGCNQSLRVRDNHTAAMLVPHTIEVNEILLLKFIHNGWHDVTCKSPIDQTFIPCVYVVNTWYNVKILFAGLYLCIGHTSVIGFQLGLQTYLPNLLVRNQCKLNRFCVALWTQFWLVIHGILGLQWTDRQINERKNGRMVKDVYPSVLKFPYINFACNFTYENNITLVNCFDSIHGIKISYAKSIYICECCILYVKYMFRKPRFHMWNFQLVHFTPD